MTIKVTKSQIVNLFNALVLLDGPDKKGPSDDSELLQSPYKFKAAAVFALSKNLRKIRSEVIDIERMRERLFNDAKESPDDKEIKGDRMKQFVDNYNAFLDSESELDVHAVKLSDLNLDENNIPFKITEHLVLLVTE